MVMGGPTVEVPSHVPSGVSPMGDAAKKRTTTHKYQPFEGDLRAGLRQLLDNGREGEDKGLVEPGHS